MIIANDWSTHIESLILQFSLVLSICMMNDYARRNASKDGDQNTDSPCDQLDYNVGTYHSTAELE